MHLLYFRAELHLLPSYSGVCREFLRLTQKLVTALLGTEIKSLPTVGLRERQILRQMHAADGIPHQLASDGIAGYIERLIPVCPGRAHAVHQPAQQGNTPGNDNHPKQES